MSIFKNSFEPGVRTQLTIRQNAISGTTRTPATIQYFNARNAWIRMTSAVEVGGDGGALARSYVLLGGTATSKSGIGARTGNAYSTVAPGGGRNRLGIRPMPGITSIDVKSKSAYGSLREVTVNFQCWDIRQLEDLELLYMRPGYSVMVEWGWMPYLVRDRNGQTVLSNNWRRNDRVLNGTGPKEDIWRDIFTEASSDGNYDAIYGIVKNYSWSARVDGGYDCTTTIITMGEILESLKVNYGAFDAHKLKVNNGIWGFANTSALRDYYNQNVIAGICAELYNLVLDNMTGFAMRGIRATIGGVPRYSFLGWKITYTANTTQTLYTNDVIAYIRLQDFIEILNQWVLINDGSQPIAALSVFDQDNNPLLCLSDEIQISTNPTVCVVSNSRYNNADANFNVNGLDATATAIKDYNAVLENVLLTPFYNPATNFGTIGNIYVSLDYIFKLATSDTLAEEDKKEKNDIVLFDLIKSIMAGVNASIGNVANFDIFIDPVNSVGRIIDVNYVDTMGRNQAFTNSFPLEIHNLNSVVRNYKLESQIFPEQTTTIAIAAQARGGALGENVDTLVDFNRNLRDRIIPVKVDPLSRTLSPTLVDKVTDVQTAFGDIATYFTNLNPTFWDFGKGDYDTEKASRYANALRDIIAFYKSYTLTDSNNRAIIPTKLSLEMDGIGGIRIGSLFRIPNDILPRGYRGGGAGPAQVAYVVTGIGHSIQNNDWVTKIDAQFILLDQPTQTFTKASVPTVTVTVH